MLKFKIDNYRNILLLLFMLFPSACISILGIKLRVAIIFLLIAICIYILFSFNTVKRELALFFNNKINKPIILWAIWCFITGLLGCFKYSTNIFLYLYEYFFQMGLLILLPYSIAFIISKRNPQEKIISFYYRFISLVFLFGVINAIGILFDVSFINDIFNNLISNTRNFDLGNSPTSEIYTIVKRVKSVFTEPAGFASFIFYHLPLIYNIKNIKIGIFKNNIIDRIVKKSFVPIAWVLLILTKSPLFLIFSIIETGIIFIVNNYKNTKKMLMFVFFIFTTIFSLIFLINSINIEKTYLMRIINTVSSLGGNLWNLIYLEPSLATRIINMVNQFILFTQHPFVGVGYWHILDAISLQYLNSPVPLTSEIVSAEYQIVNLFLLWTFLAETGILGCLLLFRFLFLMIKKCLKIYKYMPPKYKAFWKGCVFMLVNLVVMSWYTYSINSPYICICGFIAGTNLIITHTKEKI